MRWLALVCILLFGAASTAQAAHLHGLGSDATKHHLQEPAASSPGAADEEHCPLCVAMHAVAPAAFVVASGALLPVAPVVRFGTERKASPAWHFSGFSRPPPRSQV